MSRTLRKGSWTVTITLAATAAVFVALAYVPGYRRMKQLREQIQTQEQYLAGATATAAALTTTRQELRETIRYNRAWLACAPGPRSSPQLFERIQQLAKSAGVETTRFDPQPIEPGALLYQVPLRIACIGRFAQVHAFVRSLEALPETIWIKQLDLRRSAIGGDLLECELNLVMFAVDPGNSDYVDYSD